MARFQIRGDDEDVMWHIYDTAKGEALQEEYETKKAAILDCMLFNSLEAERRAVELLKRAVYSAAGSDAWRKGVEEAKAFLRDIGEGV